MVLDNLYGLIYLVFFSYLGAVINDGDTFLCELCFLFNCALALFSQACSQASRQLDESLLTAI